MSENSMKEITKYIESRPICFVYSGMGSQWIAMGRDLLKIDVFKKTFDRCATALEPFFINLHDVVTREDDVLLNDINLALVAISSIQIGLTDVFRAFGIVADVFVGHSQGEIGKHFKVTNYYS